MQPSVDYFAHCISRHSLHPTPDKIRALLEAPSTTNMSQMHVLLGMVNYYAKFLPHLSSMLASLYSLLQKNSRWSWGLEEDCKVQFDITECVNPLQSCKGIIPQL